MKCLPSLCLSKVKCHISWHLNPCALLYDQLFINRVVRAVYEEVKRRTSLHTKHSQLLSSAEDSKFSSVNNWWSVLPSLVNNYTPAASDWRIVLTMEASPSKIQQTNLVARQTVVFGICNKNFTQFRKLRTWDSQVRWRTELSLSDV